MRLIRNFSKKGLIEVRREKVFMTALVSLFFLLFINVMAGEARTACSKTATAAFKACKSEASDDYQIAVGKCHNLPDSSEVKECLNDAQKDQKSAQGVCKDSFTARKEICNALGQEPYSSVIDPNNFLDKDGIIAAPHTYYPLTPGITRVYESGPETITVTVTDDTKEILGVTCIVIHDVVEEGGEVIEDTFDWYAQDIQGNVWYFGESVLNFEDGQLVSLDGSWEAGVDGAHAGIIMKANPLVGEIYRQEFLLGDAEDMGQVLSLDESVTVPFGS